MKKLLTIWIVLLVAAMSANAEYNKTVTGDAGVDEYGCCYTDGESEWEDSLSAQVNAYAEPGEIGDAEAWAYRTYRWSWSGGGTPTGGTLVYTCYTGGTSSSNGSRGASVSSSSSFGDSEDRVSIWVGASGYNYFEYGTWLGDAYWDYEVGSNDGDFDEGDADEYVGLPGPVESFTAYVDAWSFESDTVYVDIDEGTMSFSISFGVRAYTQVYASMQEPPNHPGFASASGSASSSGAVSIEFYSNP
jgi:hypothetical protein